VTYRGRGAKRASHAGDLGYLDARVQASTVLLDPLDKSSVPLSRGRHGGSSGYGDYKYRIAGKTLTMPDDAGGCAGRCCDG
jgi:hypothetical protein